MTIRIALWLFSYVGVGLALAVGNRIENPADGPSKGENLRGVKMESDKSQMKNNLHLRAHQYDGSRRDNAVHDWLMYDELQPGGLRVGDAEMRRYRDAVFDGLSQPLMPRRNPLPFIYEEAVFQQHNARKRPGGGFKQAKKVVGLPPLVYGGTEEETPPGPGNPDPERPSNDDLFEQSSRGAGMSFENIGGLPFEPPDSPHKPQGGGIGLSPLLFDTEKPPGKRTSGTTSGHREVQGTGSQLPPPPGGAAIASQFMLRSARGNRQYDVPQIECPSSEDGMERFACPTPDRMGRYRCIDDHVLCDGFIDCPTGEDEDRQACMFYKTTKAHLDVLADALLRWARGR